MKSLNQYINEGKKAPNVDTLVGKSLVDRTDAQEDHEGVCCNIRKNNDTYHITLTFTFGNQMTKKEYKPMDKESAQKFIDSVFNKIPSIEII